MGTEVDVFDIDRQKHLGKVAVSQLDMTYDQWRTKGYDDLILSIGAGMFVLMMRIPGMTGRIMRSS